MKKFIIFLFIIGMILGLIDLENMTVFILTKIIGIIFLIPSFIYFRKHLTN